jgi:hypothetical protein
MLNQNLSFFSTDLFYGIESLSEAVTALRKVLSAEYYKPEKEV